jgi:hypothetical protein
LFLVTAIVTSLVFVDIGGTAEGARTAARTRKKPPMKVMAMVGDMVCDPSNPKWNKGLGKDGECKHLAVYRLIDPRNENRIFRPDRLITLGDHQYDRGVYEKFFHRGAYNDTFGRLKKITLPSVGNHEYKTSNASGYWDYFNGKGNKFGLAGERGKGYFAERSGCVTRDRRKVCTWRILVLNTELGGDKWDQQLAWLNSQMKNYPERCLMAVGHAGLFSTSDHYDGVSGTTGNSLAPIWEALYRGRGSVRNADLYITGHSHSYERFKPQNEDVKKVEVSGVKHHRAGQDPATGITHILVGTGGESTDAHEFHLPPDPNQVKRNLDIYGLLKMNLGLKRDRTAWAAKFYEIGSKPGSRPYDQVSRDCN